MTTNNLMKAGVELYMKTTCNSNCKVTAEIPDKDN